MKQVHAEEIGTMSLSELSTFVESRGRKITSDEKEAVSARRKELKGVVKTTAPKKSKKAKAEATTLAAIAATLPADVAASEQTLPAAITAELPPELIALKTTLPAEIAAASTVELPEAVKAPVEASVTTPVAVAAPVAASAPVAAPAPRQTAKVSVTAEPILRNGVHAAALNKVRDLHLDEVLMFAEDVSNRGNIHEKEISIGATFVYYDELQFGLWAARASNFRPLVVNGRPVRYRRNAISVPTDTVGFKLALEENNKARARGVKADDLPFRPFAEFILRDCEQTDASIREYQVAEVKRRAKELGVALAG